MFVLLLNEQFICYRGFVCTVSVMVRLHQVFYTGNLFIIIIVDPHDYHFLHCKTFTLSFGLVSSCFECSCNSWYVVKPVGFRIVMQL